MFSFDKWDFWARVPVEFHIDTGGVAPIVARLWGQPSRKEDGGLWPAVAIEKCMFAGNQYKYLGHIVNDKGVDPDPDKVAAIQNSQNPSIPVT